MRTQMDVNEIRKLSKAQVDLASLKKQIELDLRILVERANAKGTSDEIVNVCRKLERIRDALRPMTKHFRMKAD